VIIAATQNEFFKVKTMIGATTSALQVIPTQHVTPRRLEGARQGDPARAKPPSGPDWVAGLGGTGMRSGPAHVERRDNSHANDLVPEKDAEQANTVPPYLAEGDGLDRSQRNAGSHRILTPPAPETLALRRAGAMAGASARIDVRSAARAPK
jgi:hypothetical protein